MEVEEKAREKAREEAKALEQAKREARMSERRRLREMPSWKPPGVSKEHLKKKTYTPVVLAVMKERKNLGGPEGSKSQGK